MKSVYALRILFFTILLGLVFSCKKNDGYSDEIETSTIPLDTGNVATDSASTVSDTVQNTAAPQTHGTGNQERADQKSESTVGTGSGPGESSKDGSTYTIATGVQKDSARPKAETSKSKKK